MPEYIRQDVASTDMVICCTGTLSEEELKAITDGSFKFMNKSPINPDLPHRGRIVIVANDEPDGI